MANADIDINEDGVVHVNSTSWPTIETILSVFGKDRVVTLSAETQRKLEAELPIFNETARPRLRLQHFGSSDAPGRDTPGHALVDEAS